MLKKQDVKKFQEFLLNSWPAEQYYFLNGWVLRYTKGVTSRANSVFPVNYTENSSQVEKDIEIVEAAYKQYGLPSIFTMHDFFEPEGLDSVLKDRGYEEFNHSEALISPIDEICFNKINSDYEYEILNERTEEFSSLLARFTKRSKIQQEVISEIIDRVVVPKKCFILAKSQNKIIGTLMGILNPNGYIYMGDLLVDPDYRKQGIGAKMISKLLNDWAIKNGALIAWLQVEKENTNAIRLYENLGFKEAYSYYYLKREL